MMGKKPLFSVIIPTFNAVVFLKRALESLEKQTCVDFEVLVCDDGSTDGTHDMMSAYRSSMNVRYLRSEHWGGPARPRNIGLQQACGDYIAFLDADDWWYPGKLDAVREKLAGYDVIYHAMDIATPQSTATGKRVYTRPVRSPVFRYLMLYENALITSGVVARAVLVRAVGGFSESRELISVEDFDLWLRLSRETDRFTYISRSLGAYWIESGSISAPSVKRVDRLHAVYAAHKWHLDATDARDSEAVLEYLCGRTLMRSGDLLGSVRCFMKSVRSRVVRFKLRSIVMLMIAAMGMVKRKFTWR